MRSLIEIFDWPVDGYQPVGGLARFSSSIFRVDRHGNTTVVKPDRKPGSTRLTAAAAAVVGSSCSSELKKRGELERRERIAISNGSLTIPSWSRRQEQQEQWHRRRRRQQEALA